MYSNTEAANGGVLQINCYAAARKLKLESNSMLRKMRKNRENKKIYVITSNDVLQIRKRYRYMVRNRSISITVDYRDTDCLCFCTEKYKAQGR